MAWHADRIPAEITEPIVALVSLGDARPFRGDRRSEPASVEAQHPKVACAGPRISLAFRHGVHDD